MHFRVTGEWNGEPFNRVIEAENINDCYDHWMIWAQIAHADITNIRIEELKEHQAAWMAVFSACNCGDFAMYLTLQEWNARQRRPRSLETVRRWVRECRIFPPPVKDGREYLFHESAVKVDLNRPVTGSLLKRIRNGKKAKS